MALPNLSDYFIPGDHAEAIGLLQRFGEDAMLVAGGTFVHGLEARGLLSEVTALIDLRQRSRDLLDSRNLPCFGRRSRWFCQAVHWLTSSHCVYAACVTPHWTIRSIIHARQLLRQTIPRHLNRVHIEQSSHQFR